ncbi:FAD-binding protein, partial [Adlercreutzia sp. DFI.6.23]|uniref:FAD-binding protein n=1 Tax=Adlercreutzia sp. DFI.6.23 TaxID=2963705 RepID=UPI00210AC3D4
VPYVQHLWEPSYVPPTRNDGIAERLSGQGHDILFEHKMVKLVHADGKVTGAIFETKDSMKQINAKNTLLATGGYAANPVMMTALQPSAVSCCTASS